ncbi:YchJ family protein [Shewanella sp. KJ2020]|uniref:YchJ family protein n=1 Tax=Shewanella sp. KJ2020 TaxID=2919172 RepID=UPI0020A7DF22|nr:YchJ family protein [Shewanella sp. KJ2020]MCP3127350.1 YchJ family protein [Shewanella sp. KJ2020]
MVSDISCPCGSTKNYQDCCKPLHIHVDGGEQIADSPEQLMRSRYCAFVLKNFDYIIKTHHPDFLEDLTLASLQSGPHPHWLGLDVLDSREQLDASGQREGTVTFKAWYKLEGEIDAIYECSEFVHQQGRWYYTQGRQMRTKLPGRNDPCVCHSGKKFKQCCLKTL